MAEFQIINAPKHGLPTKPEDIGEVLIAEMRKAGLDEKAIVGFLIDAIKNAEVMNSKWDTIADHATRHQAIKTAIRILTWKSEAPTLNIAAIFTGNNGL
jgi:hypothetical protein